jgi:ribosome-associated protein
MDIRKLQRAIVDGLEDVKGHNIVVFNTEHLTPLFERVIIASGTSNRQTKALASSVRESVKSRGLDVLRTEGEENGEWIIVDCGAAVVHLMQPAIRDYYHLEELWGEKSVKMKLDGQAATLVKASTPASARARPLHSAAKVASNGKVGAKKAVAKKAVKKHSATKRGEAKSAAKDSGKSVAKDAARGAPKGTAKSVPRKAVARKATATRPSVPRKAPARKTVVRKAVAR